MQNEHASAFEIHSSRAAQLNQLISTPFRIEGSTLTVVMHSIYVVLARDVAEVVQCLEIAFRVD